MAFSSDLSGLASIANGVYNSITANSSAIISISIGGTTVNSSTYLPASGGTLTGNLTFSNDSVLIANGVFGTTGQVLTSNGSALYWSSAGFSNGQSISVNNFAVTASFTANGSTGSAGQVLHTNGTSVYWDTDDQGVTSVTAGNGLEGGTITSTGTVAVLGNTGIISNSSGVFVDSSYINTISSNSASYLGNSSGTLSNITSWITSNSATAYSNAVAYSDSKGYANTDQLNANVVTLQGQITANAAAAYSNAVSYSDSKGYANTDQLNANISLVQSQIVANSATAYSNAIAYSDGKLYVNTSQLSSNLTNYAQLVGAVFTGDVTTNNLTVSGNLTLLGNTVIVGANNLIVNDAVISLHSPANGAPLTSNDGRNIGIAFHYFDTQDEHGALLRENSTGRLTWYSQATDPNSSNNVTGETLGIIQAAEFYAGNNTVYSTINATSFSGTASNSTNFGGLSLATVQGQISGNAATAYSNATVFASNASNITTGTLPWSQAPTGTVNTSGDFTFTGIQTLNANLVINSSAIIANGSAGVAGQTLTSNGSAVYWSTSGFSNGQSISVNNFTVTGTFTSNGTAGNTGQYLTSNGTATYWAPSNRDTLGRTLLVKHSNGAIAWGDA